MDYRRGIAPPAQSGALGEVKQSQKKSIPIVQFDPIPTVQLVDGPHSVAKMKQHRTSATAGWVAGLAALVIGAAPAWGGTEARRSPVVAVVDGHAITQEEVDTAVAQGLYELRRRALDQMINDYLLEQAAKRAHTTIPEYLEKESAVTVSDADARAQYDRYKGLIKMPYEQIKPRLIASLTTQRQAQRLAELRANLRKQAQVENKLQPPRLQVAVGNSPALGPANAPVTIVEFGDYESPFNKMELGALAQVREKYGDKVRLVFRDFPSFSSKDGVKAAEAARCADEQGKFWQFQDALYADQTKLAVPDLKATARQLGLDSQKFDSCLDSGRYSSTIEKDIEDGLRLGIRNAPTFIVNGSPHAGAQSVPGFETTIDPLLQGKGGEPSQSH
jgi:protein-disulfide isomerase